MEKQMQAVQPQPGQLQPGILFEGRYEIIKMIGSGGMGAVYMALDKSNGMTCALKEQIVEKQDRERIHTEISIQKRLDHPALPKLYSVIERENYIYIVMEYIQGNTLQKLIDKEGSFEEKRVRNWALQLCDILCYLHGLEEPVVYRDLKPANIMIGPDDRLHLIDFGIAVEYRDRKDPNKAGMLTKGYAAPEQYDIRYSSDCRTDLYSMGVTLHYLLTGKRPTIAPYVFRRIRTYNRSLSHAMEEIVSRCLQPRPDQRYVNADELYAALSDIDKREHEILKKYRIMAVGVIAGLVATVLILLILSVSLKNKREQKIEEYYAILDKADQAMLSGDYAAAEELYDEAIRLEPDAEEANIRKIGVYIAENRYEEAFDYVGNELLDGNYDPYQNELFLEYMVTLYMAVGDEEEAEYYKKKIEEAGGK